MVKRDEDKYGNPDSGNWNVAGDYAKYMIMRYLYMAGEYASIARFGSATLYDEFEHPHPSEVVRIKALERLVDVLITLIDNSYFAVKNDKKTLQECKESLENIRPLLPLLVTISKKQRPKSVQIKINEPYFLKILNIITKISAKIKEPLNKNDLIYINKVQFDPKEAKEKMMKMAMEKG